MNKDLRKLNTCKKCGYVWFPRKERSFRCPKCDSSEWDKEKDFENRLLSKLVNQKKEKKEKKFTQEEVEEAIKDVIKKMSE